MGTKKNADRKKLKGFTLVEIIVVLVILAILAAAMIPALTGYIDKANEKTAISEARNVVTAAQTIVSEKYALGLVNPNKKDSSVVKETAVAESYTLKETEHASILSLADISGATLTSVKVSNKGKVTEVVYTTTKGYNVTYTNGNFNITTPS
ncbi:MAG: type II secretion system protein [Oscillospiraceae bacterium]|nr:type II secretion system protein [Oscillospiraceae bacterium]